MAKPRKRALGKGLGEILGDDLSKKTAPSKDNSAAPVATTVQEIPTDQIETNPFQPRTEFEEEALAELADSISQHGIIQPLTLRKLADKQYQLIAGERRLRAAKLAGLTQLPAYIRTANDEQMLEMALIENIQREDLNPVEIALSYQRMIDELGLKQNELGTKVGKKRSTVTNYLRLLKLSPDIQTSLRKGVISMGHGRTLIGIDQQSVQMRVYDEIVEKGLSVRQTEALVRKLSTPQEPKKEAKPDPKQKTDEIHLRKVQLGLEERFGSRVKISQNAAGKGEIVISYSSVGDLNRILELME
ncbi:MAG: ParB/RepB/Spo0J family partition protein [Bacteroidota bacterium]